MEEFINQVSKTENPDKAKPFSCVDCLFFIPHNKGDGKGGCRRHAPGSGGGGFPTVAEDCWCGDGCIQTQN